MRHTHPFPRALAIIAVLSLIALLSACSTTANTTATNPPAQQPGLATVDYGCQLPQHPQLRLLRRFPSQVAPRSPASVLQAVSVPARTLPKLAFQAVQSALPSNPSRPIASSSALSAHAPTAHRSVPLTPTMPLNCPPPASPNPRRFPITAMLARPAEILTAGTRALPIQASRPAAISRWSPSPLSARL